MKARRWLYCSSLRIVLNLGWSVHELAGRSGEHRTTIHSWLEGAEIDPDLAAWTEALTAFLFANPAPRKRPLPSFLQARASA